MPFAAADTLVVPGWAKASDGFCGPEFGGEDDNWLNARQQSEREESMKRQQIVFICATAVVPGERKTTTG